MWFLIAPALCAPTVELLDAGVEPRSELRLSPTVGAVQIVTVASTGDSQVVLVGPLPNPPDTQWTRAIEAHIEVLSVDPEGSDLKVTLKRIEANVEPPPQRTRDLDLATLSGLSGTLRLSSTGIASDAHWSLPAGLDPKQQQGLRELLQAAEGLSTPLPDAPVGPGARWRATERVGGGALHLELETTWTLQDVTDGVATLEASLAAAAGETELELGQDAPVTATIEALRVSGSGSATHPLTSVAPAGRRLSTTTHAEVRANKGLLPIRVVLDLSQQATLEAR